MILTIINSKGGVAKTTTAVNLSAALAIAGHRTLLVDLDQQCSASFSLGIRREDLAPSSADVVLDNFPVRNAIRPTMTAGLDILPASFALAHADLTLAAVPGRETKLRTALDSLRTEYPFIIIDCPPSLSLLPINALLASDRYLVPLAPHYLAVEGLFSLFDALRMIQEGIGSTATLLGILLTLVDYRTRATRDVIELLRQNYQEHVLTTEIRTNTRLAEAPSFGKTIFQHDPTSTGAHAYHALADEVIHRSASN